MSTRSVGIRWPADQWQAVQEAAESAGMTAADYVRAAVRMQMQGDVRDAAMIAMEERMAARIAAAESRIGVAAGQAAVEALRALRRQGGDHAAS